EGYLALHVRTADTYSVMVAVAAFNRIQSEAFGDLSRLSETDSAKRPTAADDISVTWAPLAFGGTKEGRVASVFRRRPRHHKASLASFGRCKLITRIKREICDPSLRILATIFPSVHTPEPLHVTPPHRRLGSRLLT
ncbi:hypothetical protein LSAT2_014808, partial [Lamellibrachia satsuma]